MTDLCSSWAASFWGLKPASLYTNTFFCKFHMVCTLQPPKIWWQTSVQIFAGSIFLGTKTCFSVHITHSSVNFTWFALYNSKIWWQTSVQAGSIWGTKTSFSVHITHSSVNFTWFALKPKIWWQTSVQAGSIFLGTKTCFSVHITHSSVNFTWFALYNHQKFDDRPLFKLGASFLGLKPVSLYT